MPVATQASLKGLTPKQLEDTSCRLCLNNTYHLYEPCIVDVHDPQLDRASIIEYEM